MPAPDAHAAQRWGAVTGCVVLALSFPWVNSEWKGGWLQAIGGASLLAVPAGLVAWGALRASRSGAARIVLRSLLITAVLLSLAGIYSYGPFTTLFCLPLLWIAARRVGPTERLFWIVLSAPCWLMTGALLSYAVDDTIEYLPTVVTISGVSLYVLTTRAGWGISLGADDR